MLLIEGFLKILPKTKQNVFLHSSTPTGKDSMLCVWDAIIFKLETHFIVFFSLVYAECQTVCLTNVILAVERDFAFYTDQMFRSIVSVLI